MEPLLLILAILSAAVLNADTVQHFPDPLTKKEEAELMRRMKEGDADAREALIVHNLRLVAHIVRKYYSCREAQDDLISIGTIGLIKAVDTFDSSNGTRFATYGAKCIQNEILMHFRSKKKAQNDISIYETIDTDRDGNPLTYMDIIRCEDTIADDLHKKMRVSAALGYIKDKLGERERSIIVMRYGLDGKEPLTQRETAQKLGISRSYVSRIENNTLREIYKHMSGETR